MSNDRRPIPGRVELSPFPEPLTNAAGRQHTAETILRAWLEGKSAHTIRSYQHDLQDFARYLSRALRISPPLSVNDALSQLFRQSSPSAHEVVLGFRQHLQSLGMSAAGINRHLATLRSVSKLARMLGAVNGGWHLEVPGLHAEARRDTRGPSVADVRRMLDATRGDTEAETRDLAIVLLFYCLGLRVSEVCSLDFKDVDFTRRTAWILGKARREKERVPLPTVVIDAIRTYLRWRGSRPGPLFQTRGHRGTRRDGRLDTRSVLRLVRLLGHRVGVSVWCHALRHTSITQAAELGQRAGIGLDKIRAHSRHRSIDTLMIYVDEHDRQRTQQTLADLVAGTLSEPSAALL